MKKNLPLSFFILLILCTIGLEIFLRFSRPPEYYPKSYSRILGLYEKKTHMRPGLLYRLKHFSPLIIPSFIWRQTLDKKLQTSELYEDRVNYYCKLENHHPLSDNALSLKDFRQGKEKWYYFLDLHEHIKYFPLTSRFLYLFGDIIHIPPEPSFVKSRPISENNQNSVIMKLDKGRHFIFINDPKPFTEKKNLLVWRGGAYQANRIDFVQKFQDHPLCNIADTQRHVLPKNGYMSIREQLDYKFILSLEGYDVATNLKWVMNSNSLCFAPKHRYETWFMEGRLIPNYHYVLIKDDYSDLIEKIEYYTEHTDEALAIIAHAHEHVAQFKDEKKEQLISLLVLQKYFHLTN